MRPKSIPEFTKQMDELFRVKNGQSYLDARLMCLTGRIELDVLKLDDLFHKRHGEYEQDDKSMSDIAMQEYGNLANEFIERMITG